MPSRALIRAREQPDDLTRPRALLRLRIALRSVRVAGPWISKSTHQLAGVRVQGAFSQGRACSPPSQVRLALLPGLVRVTGQVLPMKRLAVYWARRSAVSQNDCKALHVFHTIFFLLTPPI